MAKRDLTQKQKAFVRAYTGKAEGNATKAAKIAGYANPRQEGSRLLTKDVIRKAIRPAQKRKARKAIMDRDERQILLTKQARNKAEETKDKQKAIDILNKMDGEYLQRHEVNMHLKRTPEEIKDQAVEIYRENPELWAEIKRRVEE